MERGKAKRDYKSISKKNRLKADFSTEIGINRKCDYYILDISKKDTLTKLRLKSDKMSSEIQKQIATMQNISQNMFYNIDNLGYSKDDQEELFNLGNKLSI